MLSFFSQSILTVIFVGASGRQPTPLWLRLYPVSVFGVCPFLIDMDNTRAASEFGLRFGYVLRFENHVTHPRWRTAALSSLL
jgi:hypothetical protein